MTYNYAKLDGRIVEILGNRRNFANQLQMSERSLSLKMNGKVPWKQPEISNACKVLGISYSEIPLYFFTPKVQNIEL